MFSTKYSFLKMQFVKNIVQRCRKKIKSAESLRAYRNELMREVERNQLKQVHVEKDGKVMIVLSQEE